MNVWKLERSNQATLKAISESPDAGGIDRDKHPYYGFYDVTIFECPNFVMFTANDCPRAGDILYAKEFEMQSMKLWCRLAQTATGILDVGSHVGVYALAAAALRPNLIIHAVEANPYAFARLRVHKIANGFWNIAEHPIAAGDKDTFVKFSWSIKPSLQIASGAGVGQSQSKYEQEHTVAHHVPLDSLDLASTLGSSALLKIDVEGSEARVLSGMPKILGLKPDIILETLDQALCDEVNATLLPLGYRCYSILEGGRRLVERERLEPVDWRGSDLNQFLTVRPHAEIAQLLAN